MRGYLYIIQSIKNKRYYIGSTYNPKERLKEHNDGRSKYTKLTRPWKMVYIKKYRTLKIARKKEYKLKKLKSRIIIEELISTA